MYLVSSKKKKRFVVPLGYGRFPLYAIIMGACICCAFVFFIVAFRYSQSSFDDRLYAAGGLLSLFMLMVLIASSARRARRIGNLSITAGLIGFVLSLAILAFDATSITRSSRSSRLIEITMGLCWLIGSSAAVRAVVAETQLNRRFELVRKLTVISLLTLFVLIASWIMGIPIFWYTDTTIKGITMLSATTGLGLLTTMIVARISQLENRARLQTEIYKIRAVCPRCSCDQDLELGESECKKCGLHFCISVTENTCEKCGYSLYRLESAACPECGTPILKPQDAMGTP